MSIDTPRRSSFTGRYLMHWLTGVGVGLLLMHGAVAASDYTPGPFEPLMALQSMVTRKDYKGRVWGPVQKITVDQALTVATINGAYASHEEDLKGSIAARNDGCVTSRMSWPSIRMRPPVRS